MTVEQIKTIGTKLPYSDELVKYRCTSWKSLDWQKSSLLNRNYVVHSTTIHLHVECILIESPDYRGGTFFIIPISELIRIGIVEKGLPKCWAVKSDNSKLFKNTVIKYLNTNCNIYWVGDSYNAYYGVDVNNEEHCCNVLNKFGKDVVELTIQDFINLTQTNMEKQLIGYKLIKPEYKEAVYSIAHLRNLETFEKYKILECQNTIERYEKTIIKLKEAKVFDLWFEPVYEEEFKVDNWVLTSNKASGWGSSSDEIENKILQITKFEINSNGHTYVYFDKLITNIKQIVRLATKEEIESAQEIKIGDYKVVFFSTNRKGIEINNSFYTKQHLLTIKEVLEINPSQIKSLNVGCSGQFKVDLTLISKILNRLK